MFLQGYFGNSPCSDSNTSPSVVRSSMVLSTDFSSMGHIFKIWGQIQCRLPTDNMWAAILLIWPCTHVPVVVLQVQGHALFTLQKKFVSRWYGEMVGASKKVHYFMQSTHLTLHNQMDSNPCTVARNIWKIMCTRLFDDDNQNWWLYDFIMNLTIFPQHFQ